MVRFLVIALFAITSSAQVCRLSVAGLNRNRAVRGDIAAECPSSLPHSAPFGNWGVTSNFGSARDSHQFDGWCHESRVCDNRGNCRTECRDGWYEWNSCTTHPDYKAPNCTLYNANECTTQVTTTGVNVHGTINVDLPVRCPIDTNNDNVADAGGCADVKLHTSTNNYLTLYELDPFTGNNLVQSVYFPPTGVPLSCTPAGCPANGSEWVQPNGWDSPKEPAKVFAELATVVNSGTFVDAGRVCRQLLTIAATVSSASFAATVAPESIATAFGTNLAARTAADAARIFITDAAGTRRQARVYYASPGQINYVVPDGSAPGDATLTVDSNEGLRATGTLRIADVAPAVFTADGSGRGRPAGLVTRAEPNGRRTATLASDPVSLGNPGDDVVLTLFGTGWRKASQISVTLGGVAGEILYAGPQNEFAGLDQINVRLPRLLSGRGDITVTIRAAGQIANEVTLRVP